MVNTISIWTARILRIVSRGCCLLVIASFAIFAVSQSSSASAHQQATVNESATPASASAPASQPSTHHEAALHRRIDEAAGELVSPFSGITHGWSSAWATHLTNLALALALYGFGLGYLARVLRVRSRTVLMD
jgi:hypothetical protein